MGLRELLGGQAADQGFRELAVREAVEVALDLVDQAEAHLVRHHLIVEDPLLRFGDRHRLSEQVVHLDHIDAAVAHLLNEVEVIALGVVHPHDVVEQQRVAIGGREALVRPARRADHDLAQLADFRVNTVINFCHMNLRCSILNLKCSNKRTSRKFIAPP